MKLDSNATRWMAAAAIVPMTILLPAAAGTAATASTLAPAARPARPVTAYVVNLFSTVSPINTVTGKAGREIEVGQAPGPIAITP
jgi:YVTN family beta-propeller protein